MNSIRLQFLQFQYEHPASVEPVWKKVIDRWHQLDAFAYGLAEAYVAWKSQISAPPAMILLASPQASNDTDLQFARGGAVSPAKFVHTLPSVRGSSLCQVMEWSGPLICIQKDPATQIQALREGAALVESRSPVWVLSVFKAEKAEKSSPGGSGYEAQALILTQDPEPSYPQGIKMSKNSGPNPRQNSFQTDSELREWLASTKAGPGFLPARYEGGYELRKDFT